MLRDIARRDFYVAKQRFEDRQLSSVAEMHCLVHEAADLTAGRQGWKERVRSAAAVFGFDWSRTRGFCFKTARRVEAQEMDVARRRIAELREAAERQQISEHLDWLGRTLAHLRQVDPDFYREEIGSLERALHGLGASDRAVDVS